MKGDYLVGILTENTVIIKKEKESEVLNRLNNNDGTNTENYLNIKKIFDNESVCVVLFDCSGGAIDIEKDNNYILLESDYFCEKLREGLYTRSPEGDTNQTARKWLEKYLNEDEYNQIADSITYENEVFTKPTSTEENIQKVKELVNIIGRNRCIDLWSAYCNEGGGRNDEEAKASHDYRKTLNPKEKDLVELYEEEFNSIHDLESNLFEEEEEEEFE